MSDLDNMFAWSLEVFGESHFEQYRRACFLRLQQLLDEPLLGRPRDEVRSGLRSLPFETYLIFYQVDESAIHIVRVLHQRQSTRQLRREMD